MRATATRRRLRIAIQGAACVALVAVLNGEPLRDGTSSPSSTAGPADWTDDLSPIKATEWSAARAAHLLERAGFGGTPSEIARLAAMSPQRAVESLVRYDRIDASALPPFDESGIWDPGMDPFPPSRAEAVRLARERGRSMGVAPLPEDAPRRLQPVVEKFFYGLRANSVETDRLALWWANRMLATPRPLEEKLTLFWHGHFATGQTKVRDYRMMLRQNATLRSHASGPFRDLLLAVLKDPAMLVYLDNGENIKSRPNENFGRELLELFTMGTGHYTEADVRHAARAFTGWTNDVLAFRFDAAQHDFDAKTFLGRSGPFDGDDIIEIILAQPATAEFMAAKIYRYFVRDDISDEVKRQLANTYRASGYRLEPLLMRLFLSKDFYSPPAYATQIKSPVQLVVSTYKKLELQSVPTIPDFGRLTSGLGQTLFDPPNVAGWAGGRTWITPASLLQRGNMFHDVLFPDVASFRAPDRTMPPIYAVVGERLAKGMTITDATREGDAESNMMADRDEDYNTRYASYRGYLAAFERTKPIPRRPADFKLTALIDAAGAKSDADVVDHFVRRFLREPLPVAHRQRLVEFLRGKLGNSTITPGPSLESALRELLYLVLSTPEYQLG
jgi:uncharacterized protein (DUF1800 family)